jgi:hypothetical protein
MWILGNRWLPLALTTSAALGIWAIAAAHGYAWQMIWLPAAVAGARLATRPQAAARALPPAAAPTAPPKRVRIHLIGTAAAALVLAPSCSADAGRQVPRTRVLSPLAVVRVARRCARTRQGR